MVVLINKARITKYQIPNKIQKYNHPTSQVALVIDVIYVGGLKLKEKD